MKTWLRLTLITVTVGGGFTGSVLTFQSLIGSRSQKPLILLVISVFFALNVCVTVCGLMFVHDPGRTRPILVALAVQIPWISSPLVVYKFSTGFNAVLSLGSPERAGDFAFQLGWASFLGRSWKFALFEGNEWRIGINVFALVIFILLWKSVRASVPIVRPATSAAPEPNSTLSAL